MNSPSFIIAAFLATTSVSAEEADLSRFSSGEQKVQLIELYTSQGCSSCPPAEKRLSRYTTHPNLWKRIIPIAFHVDYWNYLGWKDIFSTAQATQRQRNHRAFNNISSVYTPAFVIDGQEWRGYFSNAAAPPPGTDKVGILNLEWNQTTHTAQLSFKNLSREAPRFCHAAVIGLGQNVKIESGENHGATLQQDFTALSFNKTDVEVKNGIYQCSVPLPPVNAKFPAPQQFAIASWISTKSNQPIQATGGVLPSATLLSWSLE